MESVASGCSSRQKSTARDMCDVIISLGEESGPFEPNMEFELDASNQDYSTIVDASGFDAKHIAIKDLEKETIHSFEWDERVCLVQHAYFKVEKLLLSTCSRHTLRFQFGSNLVPIK